MGIEHGLRRAAGASKSQPSFNDGNADFIVPTAAKNEVSPFVLLHAFATFEKRAEFDRQCAYDSDIGVGGIVL
jgi:hypothetical protein